MRRKDITELRQKGLAELRKVFREGQAKLITLRMEIKTEKIKNKRALSRTKDDLARMMTIIKEKEIEEERR